MQEVKTIYQDVSTQVKCDLSDATLNGWLSDNWRIESVTNGMTQDDAGMYRAVLLVRDRAQTEEEIFALWDSIDATPLPSHKFKAGDKARVTSKGRSNHGCIVTIAGYTPEDYPLDAKGNSYRESELKVVDPHFTFKVGDQVVADGKPYTLKKVNWFYKLPYCGADADGNLTWLDADVVAGIGDEDNDPRQPVFDIGQPVKVREGVAGEASSYAGRSGRITHIVRRSHSGIVYYETDLTLALFSAGELEPAE